MSVNSYDHHVASRVQRLLHSKSGCTYIVTNQIWIRWRNESSHDASLAVPTPFHSSFCWIFSAPTAVCFLNSRSHRYVLLFPSILVSNFKVQPQKSEFQLTKVKYDLKMLHIATGWHIESICQTSDGRGNKISRHVRKYIPWGSRLWKYSSINFFPWNPSGFSRTHLLGDSHLIRF